MALFADRVLELSTTATAGPFDLNGAVTGYQTFVAGIGDTNECFYMIEDVDANGIANGDWEIGRGTIADAAPDTLTRDTIFRRSNADSVVTFGAGTKRVACVMPRDALGEWISFTPTGGWTGGNLTYTGRYRLVGDTLEVAINIAFTGAPSGSANVTLNLPSGFTVDQSKIPSGFQVPLPSTAMLADSGTKQVVGTVLVNAIAPGVLSLWWHSLAFGTDVFFGLVTQSLPFVPANNDRFYINFSVPVTID